METEELIRIARGDQPADILLKNARLINVYSGEIYLTDIALADEQVAALGCGQAVLRGQALIAPVSTPCAGSDL